MPIPNTSLLSQNKLQNSLDPTDIHLNPIQKLRSKLEQGLTQKLKFSQILQCANYDTLSTYEQLLAFEQYELFQQLRKKKPIQDSQFVQCSSTRDLFCGYLQQIKLMTSKKCNRVTKKQEKQFNLKDLQKQKAKRRRNKIIKSVIILIVVLICSGALYKFRHAILNLFKLILNIK